MPTSRSPSRPPPRPSPLGGAPPPRTHPVPLQTQEPPRRPRRRIARLTTTENGKTFAESRAELRRAIEKVEVACGIPTLMQGYNLEDIARGIDEIMIRQPLGVTAAITPFNFPAMIPFWFLPYAIACGNTFILKPSERVPLTARRLVELLEKTGLPQRSCQPGRSAANPLSMPCYTIPTFALLASLAPRPSPNISTRKARPTVSACSARVARRTMWSSCPMPISK